MREIIRAARDGNQIRYYIDQQPDRVLVRNERNEILGWIAGGNTYDKYGCIVAWSEQLGLLMIGE